MTAQCCNCTFIYKEFYTNTNLFKCIICEQNYCYECEGEEENYEICKKCREEDDYETCDLCDNKFCDDIHTCSICDKTACYNCEDYKDIDNMTYSHSNIIYCKECYKKEYKCSVCKVPNEDDYTVYECYNCVKLICIDCINYTNPDNNYRKYCSNCSYDAEREYNTQLERRLAAERQYEFDCSIRRKKLIDALNDVDLELRSDNKLCTRFITDKEIREYTFYTKEEKINAIVSRMCQVKYLYDYCYMEDIMNAITTIRRTKNIFGIFEYAEKIIMETKSYPKQGSYSWQKAEQIKLIQEHTHDWIWKPNVFYV